MKFGVAWPAPCGPTSTSTSRRRSARSWRRQSMLRHDVPPRALEPPLDVSSPVTFHPRSTGFYRMVADACADWTSPTMADPLAFALPCATESSGADVLERALLQRAQAEAAASCSAAVSAFERTANVHRAGRCRRRDSNLLRKRRQARRLVDEGHMPVSQDDPPPLEGKSTTEAPAWSRAPASASRSCGPCEQVAACARLSRQTRGWRRQWQRGGEARRAGERREDPGRDHAEQPPMAGQGCSCRQSRPETELGTRRATRRSRPPRCGRRFADASAVGFADAPEPTGALRQLDSSLGRPLHGGWKCGGRRGCRGRRSWVF